VNGLSVLLDHTAATRASHGIVTLLAFVVWRSHVETVTVAASREGSMLSGTTLLIVSVVVCAVIAFAVVKHLRSRNPQG